MVYRIIVTTLVGTYNLLYETMPVIIRSDVQEIERASLTEGSDPARPLLASSTFWSAGAKLQESLKSAARCACKRYGGGNSPHSRSSLVAS